MLCNPHPSFSPLSDIDDDDDDERMDTTDMTPPFHSPENDNDNDDDGGGGEEEDPIQIVFSKYDYLYSASCKDASSMLFGTYFNEEGVEIENYDEMQERFENARRDLVNLSFQVEKGGMEYRKAMSMLRRLGLIHMWKIVQIQYDSGYSAIRLTDKEILSGINYQEESEEEEKLVAMTHVTVYLSERARWMNVSNDPLNSIVYQLDLSRPRCWTTMTSPHGGTLKTISWAAYQCSQSVSSLQMYNKWNSVSCGELEKKLTISDVFPTMNPSRNWIAFGDGLYNIIFDVFIPFSDTNGMKYVDPHVQIIPLSKEIQWGDRPSHVGSEKIPPLESIFHTQCFSSRTSFIVCAMLGRLLFDCDVLDNFEVCMFLKGRAGVGKSTLLNTMRNILPLDEIGVISSNVEPVFGLQCLPGKRCWLAPELSSSCSLNQAQLQSLISNEVMQIAVKGKPSLTTRIRGRGAIAGNEIPSQWTDNGGSLLRRLIMIPFRKKVEKVDSDLLHMLSTDYCAPFIRICVSAYRSVCMITNGRSINEYLSHQIIEAKEKASIQLKPMKAFITNIKNCTLGEEFTYRVTEFHEQYTNWSRSHGHGTPPDPSEDDNCIDILEDFNIYQDGPFLVGIGPSML